MPICLIPMDGASPVPIDKAVVLFGRQSDCDVILLNSRKVSRKHCCIAQINGEFLIRDLGSMNGIRVNGRQVQKESRLAIGDEVFIGDIGYRLAAIDNLPKKQPTPAAAPRPAADAPTARPLIKPDPRYLSQDIPVAIPEEESDFAVEETGRNLKPIPPPAPKPPKASKPKGTGSVIELSDSDIIDE
jgi:hypothetical protein